jgi:hypothetical protein
MTLGEDSDVATEDINLQNDRTCLIQGNLSENSFNQILLTDSGMFYRSVSGNETTEVTGDKVSVFDVLETSKGFSQILDDSTIDDPGYWFLHKESSGRPVWTNINALGDYIDNRVNPDNVYIGWSANDAGSEYPERKLVLFPPNAGNTTTAIDPTVESYTNNAYAWTESGWVALEPLMSRSEIIERIDSDGDASLKEFLNQFTANGVLDHKSNIGCTMRSKCSNDGYYYTILSGESYRTTTTGVGAPRNVIGDTYDLSAKGTYAYYQKMSDLSVTASANQTLRALLTESGTNTYLSKPVFIELAPFTYTNDGTSLPRTWDLHFCVKGLGVFKKENTLTGSYNFSHLTNPAIVDVSIVTCTGTPSSATVNYITDTSKTYYIAEGECLMAEATFTAVPTTATGDAALVSNGVPAVNIAKAIDYHQEFSAGQVSTGYTPYLRVCVQGISACTRIPVGITGVTTGALALGVEISGRQNSAYSGTPLSNFGSERFVEEFTDDRFMSAAYNYVTAGS